jgi:hypothetical protein
MGVILASVSAASALSLSRARLSRSVLSATSVSSKRPSKRPSSLWFAVGDVRHRSVKRVASAVGEGSIAVQMVHDYLTKLKLGIRK